MLDANCGNFFSAEPTIFSAIAVMVSLPPAFATLSEYCLRNCSSSVMSALSLLRDVRNHPRMLHVLGSFAANARHRLVFHRAPLREVGQRHEERSPAGAVRDSM